MWLLVQTYANNLLWLCTRLQKLSCWYVAETKPLSALFSLSVEGQIGDALTSAGKCNKICQLNENPFLAMGVPDDWLGPPSTSSIWLLSQQHSVVTSLICWKPRNLYTLSNLMNYITECQASKWCSIWVRRLIPLDFSYSQWRDKGSSNEQFENGSHVPSGNCPHEEFLPFCYLVESWGCHCSR